MKKVPIILLALFGFLSCEKDDSRISIMQMSVGDQVVSLDCRIQKYHSIKNEELIGIDYSLRNHKTPQLSILTSAFTFIDEYHLPSDGEASYSFIDSSGNAQTYHAIEGIFKINGETKRIVSGEFSLVMTQVNNPFDTIFDTIFINDGLFEITLDKDNLSWVH